LIFLYQAERVLLKLEELSSLTAIGPLMTIMEMNVKFASKD